MAEWRSEHLGRVRVTSNTEPAIDKVQPARDWSGLESRLREFVRFSSEVSSELAIEPHVTLSHDPNDLLALLEQLSRGNPATAANRPTSSKFQNSIDQPMPAGLAEPQKVQPKHDTLNMLSLFTPNPSKQS
jgi:hypothetical protein